MHLSMALKIGPTFSRINIRQLEVSAAIIANENTGKLNLHT